MNDHPHPHPHPHPHHHPHPHPTREEPDLFHHLLLDPIDTAPHHHQHHRVDLGLPEAQTQQPILDHHNYIDNDDEAFGLLPIELFGDDDEDDVSHNSSDADNINGNPNLPLGFNSQFPQNDNVPSNPNPNPSIPNPTISNQTNCTNSSKRQHPEMAYVSPEPHMSTQFFTFNRDSHALMIRCLREGRTATPEEIRTATPQAVLASWRIVWKDRNEDTAYLTAWKRIQEKLNALVDPSNGNEFLCYRNNSNQCVSHVDQWQEIVMNYHSDADLKHLGLKETIERIKQMWAVGAKFYGIPESFIRTCLAACPVCSDESSGATPFTKRHKFVHTESFELPAKEVPSKLQQLAVKHKVVLCIRQKYIRYKPFMAEVKDYACHRAGKPASAKKAKVLKREPYVSKRCGCKFRIRAIVPISNYNEKDKTFVYQEEGVAVFKLYAVHTGHEPGPLDGNARIIHRTPGHTGGFLMDHDTIYGVGEESENDAFGFLRKDAGNLQHSVLQQLQELKNEVGNLEGRIGKISPEIMGTVSLQLFDIVDKLKNVGDSDPKSPGLLMDKNHSDGILLGEDDLAEWTGRHHGIYGNGANAPLIEDGESFGRTLGEVESLGQMRADCTGEKVLLSETCKPEKWLKCSDVDDKGIVDYGDSKLTMPLRHDMSLDAEVGLAGIQGDNFYPGNSKWFDSLCGLDSGADSGDGGFRHGGVV